MTGGADLLARLYAAWNSGADVDAIAAAFYHPDVVWHDAAQLPGASSHHGRDDVVRSMRELVDTVGEGTISGIPFETWSGHLVTLRDGLVVEVRHFLDPEEARAAAR